MRFRNILIIVLSLSILTGCGYTTLHRQPKNPYKYARKSIKGVWFVEGIKPCCTDGCPDCNDYYYREMYFYPDGTFLYLNEYEDLYSEYEFDIDIQGEEYIVIARANYKYKISNDSLTLTYIPPPMFMQDDPVKVSGTWKLLRKSM